MEIKDIKRGIIIDGVVYELQYQPNKTVSELCRQCAIRSICENVEPRYKVPCYVMKVKEYPFVNFRKVEINEQTDQREYNDDINFKK